MIIKKYLNLGGVLIYRLVFIFIILFFILSGCVEDKNTLPNEMPDDFNFSYQYGVKSKNELNTFEDTYTKDLIVNGTVTIDMALNKQEMKATYNKMREINILMAPDKLINNEEGSYCDSEPTLIQILKIQINGERHSVKWGTDNCTNDELRALMGFTDFLHSEILSKKVEYKNLPKVQGDYE